MQDRGREESEIAGRARNVQRTGERERFAGVDGLGAREFFQIALDQIGDAQENLRSVRRRLVRPIGKGRLGGRHGKIDIFFTAVSDLRVWLPRRRLDVVEKASALRFNKLTANEVLDSGEILGHKTALSFTDNSKRCLDFARHDKEVGSTNSRSIKFLMRGNSFCTAQIVSAEGELLNED